MPIQDQGVFKDRYQIIPRALVFATRGDFVLLLKGAPNKRLWANLYNGVGGHIERGEDPITAARREFKEETGLNLINPWLCALITIDTGEPIGIGMYVFKGETSNKNPTPSGEGTLEWIQSNDLPSLPLVEDLPVLLPRVLSLNKSDPILFAQYTYSSEGKLIVTFAI